MAVTKVREIFEGRAGTRNAGNERRYTRTFLVTTDNIKEGLGTVGNTLITGIPPLYSFYIDQNGAVDLGARVHDYRVEQTDDPLHWKVHVEYNSGTAFRMSPRQIGRSGRSGNAEQQQKGQEDQNPLNRPTVIKFGVAKYQKPFFRDANGKAVINSAGERFDPIPEIDDTRIVVTFDRNESAVDLNSLASYQDGVNEDQFFGQAPGTCKINITAESAFENSAFYWKATYTVEVRREGWDISILDAGLKQLANDKDSNLILVNLYDPANGTVYTTPALLDGNGKQLAPDNALQAVFLNFQPYKRVKFAPLNLP